MVEVSGGAAAAVMSITVAHSPAAGEVREHVVQLPAGATLAQALVAAGLQADGRPCGIWGKVCPPDTVLQPGDRVECYRPLTVDPKVARRERFASQGARGAGLFAKRRANSKAGY